MSGASDQAPFTDHASFVSRLFQQHGNRNVFLFQAPTIACDRRVAHVLARHQAAPQRRTHWSAGQSLSEPNSFGCHEIDTRRANVWIPHVGQLEVSKFIRHHVDDIRRTTDAVTVLGIAALVIALSGGY